MFAVFHAVDDVARVVGRLGIDRNGIDGGVENQFLEGFVDLFALVFSLEPFAPLGNQVADGLDDAVRVLVPVKR